LSTGFSSSIRVTIPPHPVPIYNEMSQRRFRFRVESGDTPGIQQDCRGDDSDTRKVYSQVVRSDISEYSKNEDDSEYLKSLDPTHPSAICCINVDEAPLSVSELIETPH
jgi:hypothetical protein